MAEKRKKMKIVEVRPDETEAEAEAEAERRPPPDAVPSFDPEAFAPTPTPEYAAMNVGEKIDHLAAGGKGFLEGLRDRATMQEAEASVALDNGDVHTVSIPLPSRVQERLAARAAAAHVKLEPEGDRPYADRPAFALLPGEAIESLKATPPEPHRLSAKELKDRAVPNVVAPSLVSDLDAGEGAMRMRMRTTNPEDRAVPVTSNAPRSTMIVAVTMIVPSESNVRRTRSDDTELINSIRRHGILQPLLVRPVTTPEGDSIYEVVAGHRRFSAALVAGLPAVPVMIAEMNDEEALEAQLTENLQRSDIHPLEEAEGFSRLVKEFGVAIEDVIARVGKSRSYVYSRLQLLHLTEPARKAFMKGTLLASVASLLARVPDAKLQVKALGEVLGGDGGEPLSHRGAAAHLQTNYMLRLADAPFDTKDDMLVENVPACGPCPYRSGNNRDLFGDVDRADVCTNPTCFQSKVAATWAARKVVAREKGHDVMSLADSRKLFRTGSLQWDSEWVELGAVNHDDKDKRTWRQLLGKEVPQITLAQDGTGHAHELILKEAAELVIGVKSKPKPEAADEEKLTDEEREIQAAIVSGALEEMVARIEGKGLVDVPVLRAMFLALVHMHSPASTVVRRGLPNEGALEKMVKGEMGAKFLQGVIFEMAVSEWIGGGALVTAELKALVKAFGFDLKGIEKRARADHAKAAQRVAAESLFAAGDKAARKGEARS